MGEDEVDIKDAFVYFGERDYCKLNQSIDAS